jgi:hypothetical protein
MAMDLLDVDYKGDRTLPRFDIESLLYVLLWIACCGPGMKLPLSCPLRIWRTADWTTLRKEKYFVVSEREWPDFNPSFKALGDTLDEIGMFLRQGMNERADARRPRARHQTGSQDVFNERWLGGHFTEDIIRDALWSDGPQETSSVWGWPNSIDLTQDPDLFDKVE